MCLFGYLLTSQCLCRLCHFGVVFSILNIWKRTIVQKYKELFISVMTHYGICLLWVTGTCHLKTVSCLCAWRFTLLSLALPIFRKWDRLSQGAHKCSKKVIRCKGCLSILTWKYKCNHFYLAHCLTHGQSFLHPGQKVFDIPGPGLGIE